MEDTKPNTTNNAEQLVRRLKGAGISSAAIDAAWPSWWSDEIASEPSGRAELRFALARRLGISPKSLSGERVEFIWTRQAKFKNGPAPGADARSILTSFGISIARSLTAAAPPLADLEGQTALDLRRLIMRDRPNVDLDGILSFCWAVGIPVIHLRVFPLQSQSMHAMAVAVGARPAVFLARNSTYPAPTAFTLAHELGHIVLGHVAPSSALVELEDPASAATSDDQELAANRFALALLTAREQPEIVSNVETFNAPSLAAAAKKASDQYAIEPGILALLNAHASGAWAQAMSALKFIYPRPRTIWHEVNTLAKHQIDWDTMTADEVDYTRRVMGDP